ncbi:non-structural maintenance of chromosomes element 1 homolog [Centruroides vittatus]|uniref:non-structural maintenance of chromosomes element 1 homolog n=1 Tax=Centruroides vittatus TaxID=120091 RepID=UPI00350F2818
MSDLGDEHRLFLQGFMWKKICRAGEVMKLYKDCLRRAQKNCDASELSLFVNKINSHIRPMHMEIRKGIEEDTGINCYALVNMTNSSLSCLSSDYSISELEFFKKIVEMIVLSDDGVASSVSLLNLTDDMVDHKISKKEAEDLIERLVADKFLSKNDGIISLSVRSMIELDPYFREVYEENIKICLMCKQIVLQGQICADCDAKLHSHCATRYFRNKNELKCLNCGSQWPYNISQGASTSTQK